KAVPGRKARWYALARIISAPSSFSCAGVMPLTVACVPTGMNAGVLTVPCAVVRRPQRAGPSPATTPKPPAGGEEMENREPGTENWEPLNRFAGSEFPVLCSRFSILLSGSGGWERTPFIESAWRRRNYRIGSGGGLPQRTPRECARVQQAH